jgi:hypothetical protein
MPKLYEYLGILIFFYCNEHKPIHVHGRYRKCPLLSDKANEFVGFVTAYADEIIQKWSDFFVYGRKVKSKVIRKRIR